MKDPSQMPIAGQQNPTPDVPPEPPPPVDAKVQVTLSSDELEAFIRIEPPQNDGAPADFNIMQAELRAKGITKFADLSKLQTLTNTPIYNQDILIAQGEPPIDGEDGIATYTFETEERSGTPHTEDGGKVDYHDLDIVQNVLQGEVLCDITLPTEGQPGKSVKNNVIVQKRGKPANVGCGKNTEYNEDGTQILAKIDGQVEFQGYNIVVNDVMYIKENVDFSTGNIHVPNNLMIYGRILPGFEVAAGGNIEIKGIIEGAKLKAGGSINLKSGIINSELECGGELHCKYIENCHITAGGNIHTKNISNSHVKCDESILVTGHSSKIVGGTYLAGQNIEVNTLGSEANVRTRLELGKDVGILERQQELIRTIAEMESQNEKMQPVIDMQKQLEAIGRLTDDKRKALRKVNIAYHTNVKQLEQSRIELEQINAAIEGEDFGHILCKDTVYPGVQVMIGKMSMDVTTVMRNVFFHYSDGEIDSGFD